MEFIYNIIPANVIEAIGWTIFHSLWQGALISIILGLAILATDKKSAKFKYALGVTSLILLLISSTITFVKVYKIDSDHSTSAAFETTNYVTVENNAVINNANNNPGAFTSFINQSQKYFADNLPLIVNVWIFGLMIFSMRYIGGLIYIQRMRSRGINPLPVTLAKKVDALINKTNLNKSVEIFESVIVKVPVALGYLKPVILLPFGMISNLPLDQVEAIIAHEIAHIKRYDFVINIIQTFAETLFFYHPSVWWISKTIRMERENCCDDIAVELCGNSLTYSKALYNIQQMKNNESAFALAAIGNENQLLRRIKRMNEKNKTRLSYGIKFAAFALLVLVITAASLYSTKSYEADAETVNTASFTNPFSAVEKSSPENNSFNQIISGIPDTSSLRKGKRTFRFNEKENGERVNYKAKLNNGKLESLYKDGEKIPENELGKYQDKIDEKLEDYDAAMNDYRKNRNEYREMVEQYRDKMKDSREKLREYGNRTRHWDSDEDFEGPDLSELRESMRELKRNLKHDIGDISVNIPPIHIPNIDIDVPDVDVHIPRVHVKIPPIHIASIPHIDREAMNEWKHEFRESMKDFSIRMDEHRWHMDEFNDSMKVFGEKMKVFGVEMKKFGKFMRAAKDEMVKDGLIDSDDEDIDEFYLSEHKMFVNDKTVSSELHKKYLDMYEEYTGKKLEGTHKIRIN